MLRQTGGYAGIRPLRMFECQSSGARVQEAIRADSADLVALFQVAVGFAESDWHASGVPHLHLQIWHWGIAFQINQAILTSQVSHHLLLFPGDECFRAPLGNVMNCA